MAEAWAVYMRGDLAHYTYWYDHPPGGWLQLAAFFAPLNLLGVDSLGARGPLRDGAVHDGHVGADLQAVPQPRAALSDGSGVNVALGAVPAGDLRGTPGHARQHGDDLAARCLRLRHVASAVSVASPDGRRVLRGGDPDQGDDGHSGARAAVRTVDALLQGDPLVQRDGERADDDAAGLDLPAVRSAQVRARVWPGARVHSGRPRLPAGQPDRLRQHLRSRPRWRTTPCGLGCSTTGSCSLPVLPPGSCAWPSATCG